MLNFFPITFSFTHGYVSKFVNDTFTDSCSQIQTIINGPVRIKHARYQISSNQPHQSSETFPNLLAELALFVDVVGAHDRLGDSTGRFSDLQPVLNKIAVKNMSMTAPVRSFKIELPSSES